MRKIFGFRYALNWIVSRAYNRVRVRVSNRVAARVSDRISDRVHDGWERIGARVRTDIQSQVDR